MKIKPEKKAKTKRIKDKSTLQRKVDPKIVENVLGAEETYNFNTMTKEFYWAEVDRFDAMMDKIRIPFRNSLKSFFDDKKAMDQEYEISIRKDRLVREYQKRHRPKDPDEESEGNTEYNGNNSGNDI